ncbi:MAG: IclR family transcriptional regulator [Burkholderiales bacterium]|nr:IclR family transcriptional regulator [Burkholderiales bacterium]
MEQRAINASRQDTPTVREPDATARGSGTQSIQRAVAVLRILASRGHAGLRLAEIARHLRLERPTAHRILKCLCEEGVAAQDPASRRYHLGHLAFELGLAAAPQFSLRELCARSLTRLAELSGDTVFLTVRSGYDAVCIDRREGTFPIKALLLDIGTRRPLGIGAGGLALLMPLADAAVDEILQANATRLSAYSGLTVPRLAALVKRAKGAGYALNDVHHTHGAVSLALSIRTRFGDPFAAISIGAIEARMSLARRTELVVLLRNEIDELERMLAGLARANQDRGSRDEL